MFIPTAGQLFEDGTGCMHCHQELKGAMRRHYAEVGCVGGWLCDDCHDDWPNIKHRCSDDSPNIKHRFSTAPPDGHPFWSQDTLLETLLDTRNSQPPTQLDVLPSCIANEANDDAGMEPIPEPSPCLEGGIGSDEDSGQAANPPPLAQGHRRSVHHDRRRR